MDVGSYLRAVGGCLTASTLNGWWLRFADGGGWSMDGAEGYLTRAVLGVLGLGGGMGGYEGKNTFVYLKWALYFWLSIPLREIFFSFGRVVWPGGGSARSVPPPLWISTSLRPSTGTFSDSGPSTTLKHHELPIVLTETKKWLGSKCSSNTNTRRSTDKASTADPAARPSQLHCRTRSP